MQCPKIYANFDFVFLVKYLLSGNRKTILLYFLYTEASSERFVRTIKFVCFKILVNLYCLVYTGIILYE